MAAFWKQMLDVALVECDHVERTYLGGVDGLADNTLVGAVGVGGRHFDGGGWLVVV